jgi:hypothetical protein
LPANPPGAAHQARKIQPAATHRRARQPRSARHHAHATRRGCAKSSAACMGADEARVCRKRVELAHRMLNGGFMLYVDDSPMRFDGYAERPSPRPIPAEKSIPQSGFWVLRVV